MDRSLWSNTPPHPCERLARLEGQSNFLGLLAGLEAGPDTTEDAAALAFTRSAGGCPEALEAYWGGSEQYKRSLCQAVFDFLDSGHGVLEKDRIWVKGAITDGFAIMAGKAYQSGRARAKALGGRYEDFMATRKLASRLLLALSMDSERIWIRARFTDFSQP